MTEPRLPSAALLVVAAFSRHGDALDWAHEQLQRAFGPLACVSPRYPFNHTKYYDATMGADQLKQLLAFDQMVGQDQLAGIKRQTIQMERKLAQQGTFSEQRPLNLDPGLLTLGKFLLATTKDQAHRIYLRDGIYAEVTLRFQDGRYEPWPWTYADYREPEVAEALKEFRNYYRQLLNP
jgi:hypothetical protein